MIHLHSCSFSIVSSLFQTIVIVLADRSLEEQTLQGKLPMLRRIIAQTWISITFACALRAKMASFYQGHVNATQEGAEEEVYRPEISRGQLSGAGISSTKISVSKLIRSRERQRRPPRKWEAKVIVATSGKQKRRLGGADWHRPGGCARGRSNCSTSFVAVLASYGDAGWADEGDIITLICWEALAHGSLAERRDRGAQEGGGKRWMESTRRSTSLSQDTISVA
ncbi:cysteine-rich repeat secretory protein [Musa troglodytarum]|uniref:Cysteine-rich repeat secretory protein n=1 Tax=Musa troglodytarum TaxID=320322 RepID=A0A9E7HST2_9LILI|nr:cysteine-rich repeat secretory protein [Musa troglodytarum]URE35382.1 cysteine-rich repeat secretory protein [Musa troglodytarum]URE35384.1 cysteine-rich repeat secretory protein [Musa troglodytarum]